MELTTETPFVTETPLPVAFWAIIGTMAGLALLGAGFWVAWAVGVPIDEAAAPLWRFLCH
ncbi:MAG: hypothetical protein AB4911_03255 [Oscillochloridaceae bacterium umkhey_bin13]